MKTPYISVAFSSPLLIYIFAEFPDINL
jgi:hypothetical protein